MKKKNSTDNKTKTKELQLPPKDLTYRVLMERSAQIKADDGECDWAECPSCAMGNQNVRAGIAR